jgi:hypothetical protein
MDLQIEGIFWDYFSFFGYFSSPSQLILLRKVLIRLESTCWGMSANFGSGISLSAIPSRIFKALSPLETIEFVILSA